MVGKGLAGQLLTEEPLKICGIVSATHMSILLWLLVLSARPILVSSLLSTSLHQPWCRRAQPLPLDAHSPFGCPQDFMGV